MKPNFRKVTSCLTAMMLVAFVAAGCGKDEGLKIKRISPKTGPSAGGDPVTIYGSGFQKGGTMDVRVFFGKKRARVLGFDGDTKLVVAPPGGKVGEMVNVTIQFGDSRFKEIKNAYKYIDPNAGFGINTMVEGQKGMKKKKKTDDEKK